MHYNIEGSSAGFYFIKLNEFDANVEGWSARSGRHSVRILTPL
jgi:hypothetical protein